MVPQKGTPRQQLGIPIQMGHHELSLWHIVQNMVDKGSMIKIHNNPNQLHLGRNVATLNWFYFIPSQKNGSWLKGQKFNKYEGIAWGGHYRPPYSWAVAQSTHPQHEELKFSGLEGTQGRGHGSTQFTEEVDHQDHRVGTTHIINNEPQRKLAIGGISTGMWHPKIRFTPHSTMKEGWQHLGENTSNHSTMVAAQQIGPSTSVICHKHHWKLEERHKLTPPNTSHLILLMHKTHRQVWDGSKNT